MSSIKTSAIVNFTYNIPAWFNEVSSLPESEKLRMIKVACWLKVLGIDRMMSKANEVEPTGKHGDVFYKLIHEIEVNALDGDFEGKRFQAKL